MSDLTPEDLYNELEAALRKCVLQDEEDPAVLTGFMIVYTGQLLEEDASITGFINPAGLSTVERLGFAQAMKLRAERMFLGVEDDDC
jgi:hypothetical protein